MRLVLLLGWQGVCSHTVRCILVCQVTDHARQLLEKYWGQPFFELKYAQGQRRMPWQQIEEGMEWLDDCFHLIRYEDDELPSIDWVLDLARAAVLRYFTFPALGASILS